MSAHGSDSGSPVVRPGELVVGSFGPVAVGSLLWAFTDPHRGHERAYNRWYETDHYYAGCLAGPNVFAGRRWVAPRRHKQARFPADPDIGFARLDGSYAAIYFILEGHHQDWLDWAGPQAEQLHADGRGFEHRAHYNTGTYRHEWRAHRDPDPVPLELALDHPYQGLVAMWIEAEPGVRQPELDTWFGRQFLDWLPGSPVACVSSWSVLPLASEPGFMSRAAEPNTVRRLQLHFVDTDPLDCWDRYREFGGRVEASGLAHVVFAAPFIPTLVGTDRYLDELW